jgi:hypothetical protein
MTTINNVIVSTDDLDNAYGPTWASTIRAELSMVSKANDPLLSTTTGAYYTHYDGAKIWRLFNPETVFWDCIVKTPWNYVDGVRVQSAAATTKGSFYAQGGAIADTTKGTWGVYVPTRYYYQSTGDMSEYNILIDQQTNQTLGWTQFVESKGLDHKQGICTQLALPIGSASRSAIGWTPLDCVVSGYAERNSCTNDYQANAISAAEQDIYGIDRHSAGSVYDAVVEHNSGTPIPLTISMIFNLFADVSVATGLNPWANPDYILVTNADTWSKMCMIEEGKERYNIAVSQFPLGGIDWNNTGMIAGGAQGGFSIQTWNGVPVVVTTNISNQASGIGPIYLVNRKFTTFWTSLPTVSRRMGVLEGNELALAAHKELILFKTGGELVTRFFAANGKLRDIA